LTRKEEEAAVEAPPDEASSVAAENSTAKASEAKVEQAKVEQAKAEQAKAEQAKAEQAKAEQAKAEQAKAEQAKAEQAKSEQARAAATAALPPSGAAVDHGSGSSGIAWLALLLALGLAAGAGWFFVEAHKRESELVERLQSLESATTDLASSRQALETKTRSLATRTDSLGEKTAALESVTGEIRASTGTPGLATGDLDLDALGERLDGRIQAAVSEAVAVLESGVAEQSQQLQTLAAQLAARADAPSADINRDKWLLAEVEYLLRLANQRLIMTGDTAAARALLTSADNILRDLDDVGLLGVRGAIASDLASIRAAPQIDIEGNYVRLAALIDQVDRLVIFALPEVESPAIEVQTSDDWQGRLRRGYQEALDKLASYVVVRRRETPAEALMDPQWERLVRQNLRMLLEQAQVALISGNQVLYRESLDRSRHWVAEFFESDQSAAEAMNREISSLMEQTVAVELPDIADSMRELDAAVKQRLRPAGGQ
jgi:uroporphyrin-3 C-methyltransferase